MEIPKSAFSPPRIPILVHLDASDVAAIDAWRESQAVRPSRVATIRALLGRGLTDLRANSRPCPEVRS